MISQAKGRFLLISPRKVRMVTRLLKGVGVEEAQAILAHLPQRAAEPVAKVLKSAVANATRGGAWKADQLVISRVMCDEGPSLKRFRAGPMGRAMPFKKRMSHLKVELEIKNGA